MSASNQNDPNLVSITVGGQKLSGWQVARVTRSIERFPSDFELELTERYPDQSGQIVIHPGDPCVVTFGADTVISGYVDDYRGWIAPSQHSVTISGRSKCVDLVDCSGGEAPYALLNTTLFNLAKGLCQPYGITVSAPDGDSDPIPQHNITLTECTYEILSPIAEWANFLLYDDTNGNLVIGKVGDGAHSSGFAQGMNVQAASVQLSVQNRFTEIDAIYTSNGFLMDGAPGIGEPSIPFVPNAMAVDKSFPVRADGKPRFRRLLIISEQSQVSGQLAAQRAQWEMARRVGRSQQVHLTCDTWRDSAGKLWTPNYLANVNIPALKLPNLTWLIVTVTFLRNATGTTAELVLMPRTAFIPEPVNLAPFDPNIAADLPSGSSTYQPAPR